MSENKKPLYEIHYATEPKKEGDKSFWTRIGAAWENKDGSLNLSFQAAPLSLTEGTVQLRRIEDKKEKKAA